LTQIFWVKEIMQWDKWNSYIKKIIIFELLIIDNVLNLNIMYYSCWLIKVKRTDDKTDIGCLIHQSSETFTFFCYVLRKKIRYFTAGLDAIKLFTSVIYEISKYATPF